MRFGTFVKSVALVMLLSSLGLSQVLRESFDYSAGTALDTMVGEAGNGWANGWHVFEGSEGTLTVSSTDFIWDFTDFPIPHVANHILSEDLAAWAYQRSGRELSQTWADEAGKVYWLSFAMEIQNFTDQGWAGVSVYNKTGEGDTTKYEEGPLFGKGWGNVVYSIGSDTLSETKSDFPMDGGAVWVVAKMVMSGDTSNERIFMWLNPNPAEPEPDTTTAKAKASRKLNDGFNLVAIHYGGGAADDIFTVDEIRLGTSWEDVSSDYSGTGVTKPDNLLPAKYSVSQNYPNPFNPTTNIHFSVKESGLVTIKLYNLIGQEVAVILNEHKDAGNYNVDFNAAGLTSGIYLYKITAGNFIETKKMTLLK